VDTTAAAPTTDKATEVLRVVTACAAAPSVALCNNVVLWTPSRALALRAASVTARANAGLAAASVQGSSIGIDVTLDRDKTALYVTLTIRRRTWAVLGQHFSAHGGHESSPHRVCAVSAGQAVRKHRGNESGLAALLEQSLRVTRGALPVAVQLWLVLHVRGRSRGSGDQ
jgi:hypothetical protein